MKIMIVGSGGREHALGWKIAQSGKAGQLIFAGGNGGMQDLGECIKVSADSPRAIARLAAERSVDLTVIGPEAPLAAGVVDELEKAGLRAFGPRKAAAMIEGSKKHAKGLMARNGIPTARSRTFTTYDEAESYVLGKGAPLVVKADGLAAGKGVTVALTTDEALGALEEIMIKGVFGSAGKVVVIEEMMEGPEVSILSLSDGKSMAHMVAAQDHKRIFDGDKGPNTGGMGAYSPVPLLDIQTEQLIHSSVMEAMLDAMASERIEYRGVLYGGLMLTGDGPRVLEFNARFGDPETQVVLPRMRSDLLDALLATVDGTVGDLDIEWSPEYCISVVLASGGYPGEYRTGVPINGLKAAAADSKVELFHAGTTIEDGRVITDGGRVMNVVARGSDFNEARGLAYDAVRRISFEGMYFRTDIGFRAMSDQGESRP